MALCDTCQYMNNKYDEFRQAYNDADVIDENKTEHFCPMYDDHIPNGIYYDDEVCEHYAKR